MVAHITNQPPSLARAHESRGATWPPAPMPALSGIMHLLLQLGGIDFQDYKPGTVMRRIERRMAVRR
jgi:two-component system CheB/CheR fusion protein